MVLVTPEKAFKMDKLFAEIQHESLLVMPMYVVLDLVHKNSHASLKL